MKKITSLLLIVFLVSRAMMSQTYDDKAVKLLKEVSQKYNNYKTMQMDISLTVENLESKSKDVKTGVVKSKGNMFNVDLGNQQIICDGKIMWVYLKKENEVQINNFEKGQDIMSPNDIFKIAEKDYLAYLGEIGGLLWDLIFCG